MNLSQDIKSITYLKNQTTDVVQRVSEGRTMVITQNGEARMVIMGVEEYDRLQNALALLKILQHSETEVGKGKSVPQEEVFRRIDVNIIRFVADDSPVNAEKRYHRIRKKAAALKKFPNRGRIVAELGKLDISRYRELSAPPCKIVYRIDRTTVLVLAIFDGRRDLRQLLAERLLRAESF